MLLTANQSGLRSHTHSVNKAATAGGDGSGLAYSSTSLANTTGVANAGPLNASEAHNNLQPYLSFNYVIKG